MRKRLPGLSSCFALLWVLLPARVSSADPVTVRVVEGQVVVTSSLYTSHATLIGTQGFTLFGGSNGFLNDWCSPCVDNQAIAVWGNFGSYTGMATYRNEEYRLGITSGSGFISLSASPITLPPAPSSYQQVTLSAPFSVTGIVAPYDPEQPHINFFGSGTVFVDLIAGPATFPGSIGQYTTTGVRFEFSGSPNAVTPEPATLFLIGSGLAAGFLRRRKAAHNLVVRKLR